jgi:hypothetical protein
VNKLDFSLDLFLSQNGTVVCSIEAGPAIANVNSLVVDQPVDQQITAPKCHIPLVSEMGLLHKSASAVAINLSLVIPVDLGTMH